MLYSCRKHPGDHKGMELTSAYLHISFWGFKLLWSGFSQTQHWSSIKIQITHPKSRILGFFHLIVLKKMVVTCKKCEKGGNTFRCHELLACRNRFLLSCCVTDLNWTNDLCPLQVQELIRQIPQSLASPVGRRWPFLGISVGIEDEIRWKYMWSIQQDDQPPRPPPCPLAGIRWTSCGMCARLCVQPAVRT